MGSRALPSRPRSSGFKRGASDDRLYDAGQRALENRRWDEALEDFNQVAATGGTAPMAPGSGRPTRCNKLGRRDDALAAIAELRKSYPQQPLAGRRQSPRTRSQQASGQNVAPESESDDDLKLLALNGLMQSDPDRAFPLLETLLKSAQSPSSSATPFSCWPRAARPKRQQFLEQIARGGGNPDLQLHRHPLPRRAAPAEPNGPQILSEIYTLRAATSM